MTPNRRRFQRLDIELAADVLTRGGDRLPLRIHNLSRGGVLLAGDSSVKTALYRRKSGYTHRPLPTLLEIHSSLSGQRFSVIGSGAYLRRIHADSFQIGFRFLEVQSQAWFAALLDGEGGSVSLANHVA